MKRPLAAVLVVLLGLGNAGCPSSRGTSDGKSFTPGAGGSLVHKPSRIAFPARVGDFAREGTRTYVADGSDVSAAYNYVGPDGAIAATSYVYPSPKLVSIGSPQHVIDTARAKLSKDEFERRKQELVRAHPQAVLVSESPFTAADGRRGVMAEYEYRQPFAGAVQRVRSRLYLLTYVNGSWAVKHRITFPAGMAAQSMVDRFVREFGPK